MCGLNTKSRNFPGFDTLILNLEVHIMTVVEMAGPTVTWLFGWSRVFYFFVEVQEGKM
jgi:hypothetical protein